MQLGDIFSDALKYPLSNYNNWLMVGVLCLICSLAAIVAQFGMYSSTLACALGVLGLLAIIVLLGYNLTVIKNGIESNPEIPDFDWVKNFVDGIKYIVVAFVYFIIPAIISTIIAILTGYGPLSKILTQSNLDKFAALNGTVTQSDILNIVPADVWNSLFTSIAVTAIIALILFIIFAIFQYIAICRLSKYGNFGEAFNFKEIYADIKKISILKIIAFLVISFVISSVIGIILGFIAIIPFIGLIIAALFGHSFIILFNGRSLGLLYSEV